MLHFWVSKWLHFGAVFMILSFWAQSAVVRCQELSISNSVGSHICAQQQQFQESSSIQEPIKKRPENNDAKCGRLTGTKCDPVTKSGAGSDSDSDSACPSFKFEACQEEPKKGRSAISKQDDHGAKCEPPLDFPGWDFVSPLNKYPSLVAIHFGIGCFYRACWSLILNAEWLLVPQTSGCFARFVEFQADDFHIFAGDRILWTDEGTEQERKVAEFISHPDFNYDTQKHYRANLGLVRLDRPLEFNDDVQPIDLAVIKEISSSSSASPLENLVVATWFGDTDGADPESKNKTTQVEFPVDFVPDSECYDKFMEEDGAAKESLICAGKCLVSGDVLDPGPKQGFLFTLKEGVRIPVGIGPIKQFESDKNGPFGVFTVILFYIPWIEETVQKQQQKVNVKGQGQGRGQSQGQIGAGSGRLAGSSDSPSNKYPSMVNLLRNRTSRCRQHNCGATLLSPTWVLTAAHCVENNDTSRYKLILGDHDLSKIEQEVAVETIILHEDYNDNTYVNDIALLKVSPPVQLSETVQPAKLPPQDFETEDVVQACGWGTHEGYVPHILQEVEMPIIPMKECLALTEGGDSPPKPEMHICVGTQTIYPCPGDSGGPIYLHPDESGEQTVIGAASRVLGGPGPLCGGYKALGWRKQKEDPEKQLPTVYTKVAHYIEWIRKNSDLS